MYVSIIGTKFVLVLYFGIPPICIYIYIIGIGDDFIYVWALCILVNVGGLQ
jgi:hypothetical protein